MIGISLLALAQVADIASTRAVLARPGFGEANPLVFELMQRFGRRWWLPKLAIAAGIVAGAWALAGPDIADRIALGGALVTAAAVAWNVRILIRRRR